MCLLLLLIKIRTFLCCPCKDKNDDVFGLFMSLAVNVWWLVKFLSAFPNSLGIVSQLWSTVSDRNSRQRLSEEQQQIQERQERRLILMECQLEQLLRLHNQQHSDEGANSSTAAPTTDETEDAEDFVVVREQEQR